MTGDVALSARGLRRRLAGRDVVDGVDLDVSVGETVVVLGPNGAGKSTLFRMLLLLERPDSGHVEIDGRPARPGDTAAARSLAAVFQRPILFSGSVRANVEYGLRARGVPADERLRRAHAALEEVGLADRADGDAAALSGGEAQRVALARALVVEPKVLLLDEPTSNLDIAVRRRFRADLERLSRRHAHSVLLITHDPAEAFGLADRVAVMEGGRIVQEGTPDAVVADPATPFVAEMTGAELVLDGRVVSAGDDGLVEVELPAGARILAVPADPLAAGDAAHVAYRPEDVVLATPDADSTSARNRLVLTVAATSPAGGLVRVRLTGPAALVALVTRGSAEALGIRPGATVEARTKAAALRAYAAGR